MKSIFRATAILGSASVINILIGIVSSKVTALLLGPSGFGLMALLQAVVTLAVLAAGLGIPSALVRAVARAVADRDAPGEAALRRAAWMMCAAAVLVVTLAMVVFQSSLSQATFDTPVRGTWIVLMAPAVAFSLMAGVQTAVLNGRQRVGDLARIAVISAAISLVPTITLVWLLREQGVAPAVLANTFIIWLVGFYFYRRNARQSERAPVPPRAAIRSAAGSLLGFGIPLLASTLVGNAVLTLIPIMVLHALGPSEVGLLRAASAIAINYLGVLLAAMAQDYFPRVAAAPDDAGVLTRIINEQLRLVLLVGGPVILAMLGAVPYLVPLLYSHAFAGAADLLEWQLIGDLFKFTTWTMSFVIMARLTGRTYFYTELGAGLVLLASSWFGMRLWGLAGLGIAFLATSAIAGAVSWAVLRRRMTLRWTRANATLFVSLLAAMMVVRALPWLGYTRLMPLAAALFAIVAGAYSAVTIWRELGGWQGVRRWRQAG